MAFFIKKVMAQEKKEKQVIIKGGVGEIVEKKSRFIATIAPCKSEEEATAFVEATKKQYWDARHNCSAFVVGSVSRCSDDGEPSGTAGRPMLEVLLGHGFSNAAVVVTRYFGGVLLGTGGLVKAYTQAVQAALENCVYGIEKAGLRFRLTTDYNAIGKVLYILEQQGIKPADSTYAADVTLELLVPLETYEPLCKALTEATAGRVHFTKIAEETIVETK